MKKEYLCHFCRRILDHWILPPDFSSRQCSFVIRRSNSRRYPPEWWPGCRPSPLPKRPLWRRPVRFCWTSSAKAARCRRNADYRFEPVRPDARTEIRPGFVRSECRKSFSRTRLEFGFRCRRFPSATSAFPNFRSGAYRPAPRVIASFERRPRPRRFPIAVAAADSCEKRKAWAGARRLPALARVAYFWSFLAGWKLTRPPRYGRRLRNTRKFCFARS